MNIMAEVQRLIYRTHRELSFLATVTDTSGSTIQVQRDGQAVPDASYYQGVDGLAAAVSPGDRVYVVDVTGSGGYLVVAALP